MRPAHLLLLILLSALGVGACRGGGDGASGTSALPASTATTPATTAPASRSTTSTAPLPTSTTSTTLPPTTTTVPLDPLQGLALEVLATDLSRPTFVTSLAGDERLFVLEAVGRIQIVGAGGVQPEPFLNIRNKVLSNSIEQGLLGLAFHPAYETNGRFFVYYTDASGNSILAEYQVSDDPDQAIAASERVVLEIAQPDERHNAGMLQFGPDGYLYLATGDGGAGGASVNGQHPETLLSAVLRLDIDGVLPYSIPPDNPFADGVDGAPEVWAYGLRNPWRFSIDAAENLLYIGDVGQEAREEIDVVALEPVGYNFGWPSVEGTRCFSERDCDPTDYVLPAIDYTHEEGLSVTGGYVYRGRAIPELVGHYFYADWVREWIRSFRYEAGTPTAANDWTADLRPGQINSFGLDGAGELLIATWAGTISRIVPVRGVLSG